ncbi:MAG: WD40 repeat domain-containing protein [Lewinellaceae bacterium]|nr:WD40 repeat domain-containing protein [Lewinellaceae bacterium]
MERAERHYIEKDYASTVLFLKMATACDPNRQDTITRFYRKLYDSLKILQQKNQSEHKPKTVIKKEIKYIPVKDSIAIDTLKEKIDSLLLELKRFNGLEKINNCNYNNALALSKLSTDIPLALKIIRYNQLKFTGDSCCTDSLCTSINLGDFLIYRDTFFLKDFPHETQNNDKRKRIVKDGDFSPESGKAVTTGTNGKTKLWNLDGDLLGSISNTSTGVVISQKDNLLVTYTQKKHKKYLQIWSLNDNGFQSLMDKVKFGNGVFDFLLSEVNDSSYILYLSKNQVLGKRLPTGKVLYQSHMNTFPGADSLGLSKRPLYKFGWCRHSVKIWPSPHKKNRFWQLPSIRAFDISQRGNYFITGDKKGWIRFRSTTDNSSRKLKRLNGPITSIDISEDGLIAAGSANGEVAVWNDHGHLLHFFYNEGIEKINAVKFPQNYSGKAGEGRLFYDLVIAGEKEGKGVVSIWKEDIGFINLVFTLLNESGEVSSLKVSPDGHYIMATTTEGKGYLWQSGKKLLEDIENLDPDSPSLLEKLKEAGVRLHN